MLEVNSLCQKIFLANSPCFTCLEKWTSKFPVFPVRGHPFSSTLLHFISILLPNPISLCAILAKWHTFVFFEFFENQNPVHNRIAWFFYQLQVTIDMTWCVFYVRILDVNLRFTMEKKFVAIKRLSRLNRGQRSVFNKCSHFFSILNDD